MPRLSNLQYLKNNSQRDLLSIRNRLDPRTFRAFERKINNATVMDNAKKLASEIRLIKNKPVQQGLLTAKKIKEQVKAQTGLQNLIIQNKPLKPTAPVLQQEARKNIILQNIRQPTLRNVLNKQPKFAGMNLIDRVKFFSKYGFRFVNIKTEEQFYNAIKDAEIRFPNNLQPTSVSIYIKDKEAGNKVRAISLSINDLFTFDTFKEALNRIISGNFAGSDAIDLQQYEIVYDEFALASANIAGEGSSEDMIYEVYGIEQSKRKVGNREVGNGDCAYQCLLKIKELGIDINFNDIDINKLRNLEYLMNFIQSKKLPIDIITNSFRLKKNQGKIIYNNPTQKKIVIKDKKGMERNYICSKIVLGEDVESVKIHHQIVIGNDKKYTIIYDEINQHYDVIKDNLKIRDNIYLSLCCKVIKDDKILFTAREVNKNSKAEKKVDLEYVFFDYETVIDFTKNLCMKEYSLSILVLNSNQLVSLAEADEKKDEKEVQRIRRTCCKTFLGYDCSPQFIKWIIENQGDKAFVFVGFNNANFDNFIFLDALLRHNDMSDEFSVSDIRYNGSQLLDFTMAGRHSTFDIHKHLMGSLKANCESFKINCCAKKSFDHNKAQQLYLDGKLIDFITDNDELKEYNEYDVLATAVLFQKYKNALLEIKATKEFAPELHSIKTVGSLIFKVFEKSKKEKKFELPKLSFERYNDLQKSKIAGRVELFNGVQKVMERLVSTDVCSLYPYVMAILNVYYPCGEIKDTDKYMGKDVIGFYYCDIDQSNLRGKNLPKIYAKKTTMENDWGHEEVLENYLISNVIIELLLRYGCKVVIKNGFYFTEKKKSCDMFDFLLDFMSAKNEQDTNKKNKVVIYNPALRETLKLLMNSLSGKVIEGLHTDQTKNVDSVEEYMKIKEKSESINTINTIGNKIFVSYEVSGESLIHKQRPIYLGVLIYDYAKSYMYDYSYSKVGLDQLLYTDTDASKFRYKKFLEWKEWVDTKNIQVPHWEEVEKIDERYKNHKIYETGSKVFGSFEDELEDNIGTDYVFYCLQKKSWCYAVDGHSKFRFKGLNGSALLLTLGEDFIKAKTIKHKSKNGKDAWEEKKYYIEPDKELEVYNYAQNNKHTAIENNNELKFFEQIYSTGEAYLLCSSFRKIVKNSAHNVELGNDKKYNNLMNKVQVNYMMKHINLYKK
jgi:hypothetical protein